MLLEDFVVISNLTAVFAIDEPDDRRTLVCRLARFSLLLLGADALTPKIIARVWGENEVVRRNLGGPRGNLAIVRRWLISLASVANNTFHLWLTTKFNGGVIIPLDTLQHLPPGVRDILQLVTLPTAAVYVREPLPSGHDRINILQNNLRQNLHDPSSFNFNDIIVGWYCDLFSAVTILRTPLVWRTISSRPTASSTHPLHKKRHTIYILSPRSTPLSSAPNWIFFSMALHSGYT